MLATRAKRGSRARSTYGTPWGVYFWAAEKFGRGEYDLDVCAEEWSAKCRWYFTKEDDALSRPWGGRCWCNPPFDEIERWLAKGWLELVEGRIEFVTFLLPHRADRRWFQAWKPLADIAYEPEGRIPFLAPPGVEEKDNPFEATVILHFERRADVGALTREPRGGWDERRRLGRGFGLGPAGDGRGGLVPLPARGVAPA